MNYFIATSFWIFAIWLIRKDTARRDGISRATWIPTLWAGILLSRPLSIWVGFGGATDSLEGSPLDRLFYFGMIFLALVVLSKRNVRWAELMRANWPIFLFYGYFLISVLWADFPLVAFKRWFKDFGNVFIVLVMLTERNPLQAIRVVFVRCGYVLLPLSVIFARYFPSLGRTFTRGGGLEVTGVTTQKNSLGTLVVVCGLVLLWDWIERTREDRAESARIERYLPFGFFLIGAYLLHLCDSATSILCLAVGGIIIFSTRLPILRERVGAIGGLTLMAFAGFFLLDWMFGIKEAVVAGMGRDMTFTGRTDIWRELLGLKTDPFIGTGFYMIWSDQAYLSRLPEWMGATAHNGYLETYIDGGMIGLFFLGVMLIAMAWRINSELGRRGNFGLIRLAALVALVIGDFSESHFGRMSPLFLLFLVMTLEVPWHDASEMEEEPGDSVERQIPAEGVHAY